MVMVSIITFLASVACYFLVAIIPWEVLPTGDNSFTIGTLCGGFIMLATGFRMCKIKQFPVADMIPAMVLIFPIAIFWNDCVTPAVNMLAGMVH